MSAIERLHRFDARVCPCCGWTGLRFRSFAVLESIRAGVICPRCGSFERHRALVSFYPREFERLGVRPARLIHFAPEPCLQPVIRSLCQTYETSSHGEIGPSNHRLDVTNMALSDASCDALLLNHVLDCIPDDRPAIAEMHRVLRPGGVVLAVVTFAPGVATREVPVLSNSLHRIYGSVDLAAHCAPFTASVVNGADGFPDDVRRTRGIQPFVPVLVLRK